MKSFRCLVASGQWLVASRQWRVGQRLKARVSGLRAAAVAALAAAALVGCQSPAPLAARTGKNNAKNVYDVRFGTLPENCESLLETDPGSWDSNFRPYGRTTDLWTDPGALRDVGEGRQVDGKPTALRVSCDEDGWSFLVYCGEPGETNAIAAGRPPAHPSLELYVCEGDADNSDIAEYWQLYLSSTELREFTWAVPSRRWRYIRPYVRYDVREAPNAYVARLSFPWYAFWDRLPVFSEGRNNFWRLGVMRWAAGGQTWGGIVHEPDRFGYIRWPAFTEEQKGEILARTLRRGWLDFCNLCATLNYDTSVTNAGSWARASYVRTEPYARAAIEADGPRTWMLAAEDPELRPILAGLQSECRALGPKIARFRELPYAEKAAFYREAAPKLFNFRYDVEAAIGRHAKSKIMEGRP